MTERFTPTDQQAAQERIAALRAELDGEKVEADDAHDPLGVRSDGVNAEVDDLLASESRVNSYRSVTPRKSTADAFGLEHGGSKRG